MASPSALSQAGGLISHPPTQIDMSVLAVGIEKMCELSVADRVNFKIFQLVLQGTSVRVGGTLKHVSSGEQRLFTTSDGGDIVITSDDEEISSNLMNFGATTAHRELYTRSTAMASSARLLVFDECCMLSAVLIRKILYRASSGGSLVGRDTLSAVCHSVVASTDDELDYNLANHFGKGLSRL